MNGIPHYLLDIADPEDAFDLARFKNLAKEAVIVGNETQEYTQSTSHSINNIADILNVESLVTGSLNGASAQNGETPETKTAESDVTAGTNDDASNGIESDETGNNVDAAEKEN